MKNFLIVVATFIVVCILIIIISIFYTGCTHSVKDNKAFMETFPEYKSEYKKDYKPHYYRKIPWY